MFCAECGNKIEENANFCPRCGTPVKIDARPPAAPTRDNNEPVLTIRPVFIPWVTVASILPLQLFMTLWGGGFFGGFSMFGAKALNLPLPGWSTFVFFGLLFFLGIPVLAYTSKKRTYCKTEYKFYPDRLEYAEGFWTAENKTINYRSITEANLRRGVIQRKYGLGTIYLATPATGISQGRAVSGIKIEDIPDCEKIYNTIRELINTKQ